MKTSNLIYIHIGDILPEYIYDSIYQTLLVSNTNTKIYVILNETLIPDFYKRINMFNLNIYSKNEINIELHIQCIPISILQLPSEYSNLIENLPQQVKTFRNSFWIYTIARFFYIYSFMKLFRIKNGFHIENDIMLYEDLSIIESSFDKHKLYMIKDSTNPPRVIASLMYLNIDEFEKLLNHMITQLKSNNNLNDMQLLGSYKSNNIEYLPFDYNTNSKYIYDGACMGQFLGGVDPRNIPDFNNKTLKEQKLLTFNNPTVDFINETCTFKANNVMFYRKGVYLNNIKIPVELVHTKIENKHDINIKNVINLHIHSKQLYQFSSIFNMKYNDIISGDRILTLCDFVLMTPEIFNYHRNIDSFVKLEQIIIVKNFEKINIKALNLYFNECVSKQTNDKKIKLFIYTHILDAFIKYILPHLDDTLHYYIYLHNSDHGLEEKHYNILNSSKIIKKIFSQNINCTFNSKKFCLLPIGIANSMFKHGDIMSLYETMAKNYYKNKSKNLYININPNTFNYRQKVLNEVTNDAFNITSTPRPFIEYLQELSTHRFSLCVRGNGISCHRDYESLYLGVIPVIINNKFTNMHNHVEYLRHLGLPFYEIKEDTLEKYSDEFFNEALYKKIIKECGSSIYNLPQLKLSYYS